MKKIFENAVWWSGVVMVGLILGVSLQFVRAWTEPTQAPPNGNVGAPLNTGLIGQLKQGALGINGLLKLYGGFQIPTGAGAGKVLTSDAAGNAYWASPAEPPPAPDLGEFKGSCSLNSGAEWPAMDCAGPTAETPWVPSVVTRCWPGWCPTGNTCSSHLWAISTDPSGCNH